MSDFFNNSSVAAFLGAVFAFLLVAFTDIRRRYRTKRLLKELVSDNLDLTRKKLESVEMNIALLREDRKITNAPIMRFPTGSIKNSQSQVLDLLNANEKQALDGLIYWMEAVDDVVDQARARATELKEAVRRDATLSERQAISAVYLDEMESAERNLRHLARLLEYYVAGNPHKILEFYHPVVDEAER